MDKEKVLNLAKLARIEVSQEEAESLSHEFEAILNYVGEVKAAGNKELGKMNKEDIVLKNVMREDADPDVSGLYTEKILEQAPDRDGSYIKVKKIL